MKTKFQLPDVVIFIALASTLLYVVAHNLPIILGSFRFFWGPVAFIVIVLTRPSIFKTIPMRFLLLFGTLSILILPIILWTSNVTFSYSRNEEFYALTILTAIWSYFSVHGDFNKLAIIGKWSFIFILITLITTNIALTIDPLIVRNSAAGFFKNTKQIGLAKITGSAGYDYAQSFILLIPILVYHIKNKKEMVFSRNILITILILILITTLRANVFANVLVASLSTFLSFLGSKKRKVIYRYIAISIIFFVIIPSSFYSDSLRYFGSKFGKETEMYYKLNDFALFIEAAEIEPTTGAGGRAARYPLLFEAMLANPLAGQISDANATNIDEGGHLYLMYKLTRYGIPFFFFFIFVLYKIYKSIISVFPDNEIKFYYWLSVVTFLMFGLVKNIAGRENWVFMIIVIPGLYLLPLIHKKRNSTNITRRF